MKVPFKKPSPELRFEGGYEQPMFGAPSTFKYPSNHPMRIYKDRKRALKQAKQSNQK